MNETILITGCAGFIGMHLAKKLLSHNCKVVGIDNLNEYYDVRLKLNRLSVLKKYDDFIFEELDICDFKKLSNFFKIYMPNKVVNLAAQAGVRYSLINPHSYIQANIVGFMNILECCRKYSVEGLIYASSSSVYGGNKTIPFSESDNVDSPISIYAASKKSNELMAHSYYKLFGLKSTGLRFFTVYGPWGRPDMAMYIFANNILDNKPIEVYNDGKMSRDFTYIDDIIIGITRSINYNYDYEIFNLGNSKSENLMDIVALIEKKLEKKAIINYKEIQPGDVEKTYANIARAKSKLGFSPETDVSEGVGKFIDWFIDYKKHTTGG